MRRLALFLGFSFVFGAFAFFACQDGISDIPLRDNLWDPGGTAYDPGTTDGGGQPPAAPAGVTCTPGHEQNTIAWSPSTGAVGYKIRWLSGGSNPGKTAGNLLTGVWSSYVHPGLANGTEYRYVVLATNADGESPVSQVVSGTPRVPIPEAPTNVAARIGNRIITLYWDDVPWATSYVVRYAEDPNPPTRDWGYIVTNAHSPCTLTAASHTIMNRTLYRLIVMASSSTGLGPASAVVEAFPNVVSMTLAWGGAEFEMLWIPPGEFTMGYAAGFSYEQPEHSVRITRGFYIGRYEVKQSQYLVVMGSNRSQYQDPDNPVERISWADAQAFCAMLSAQTAQTVRLPTEAQWEYACRAGTTTPYSYGAVLTTNLANFASAQTRLVGSYNCNDWGLFDMHGNVLEYCRDYYDANYYAASPVDDPPGPLSAPYHSVRGGAWNNDSASCRSSYRTDSRDFHLSTEGFRIVLCVDDP